MGRAAKVSHVRSLSCAWQQVQEETERRMEYFRQRAATGQPQPPAAQDGGAPPTGGPPGRTAGMGFDTETEAEKKAKAAWIAASRQGTQRSRAPSQPSKFDTPAEIEAAKNAWPERGAQQPPPQGAPRGVHRGGLR